MARRKKRGKRDAGRAGSAREKLRDRGKQLVKDLCQVAVRFPDSPSQWQQRNEKVVELGHELTLLLDDMAKQWDRDVVQTIKDLKSGRDITKKRKASASVLRPMKGPRRPKGPRIVGTGQTRKPGSHRSSS